MGSDLGFKFPLWTRHKASNEETGYEVVRRGITCPTSVSTVMGGRKRFAPYLGGQIMIGG